MSTAHVLLGLLVEHPQHGYELKQAHDAVLPGAKPLAFGQVYATLGRLERDGLVAPAAAERSGGPDRVSFRVTPAGRRSLHTWLDEIEPPAPRATNALLAKVVVALLAAGDDRARQYLTAQRKAHTQRLRELTRVKTDPHASVSDVVAADYAIAHLDADLRWLDTTLARVADLKDEVRR